MAVDNNSTGKSSSNAVPVYLIPWDPDSQEHVDRMKLQRIACGWKVEQVDGWKDAQRKGHAGLHWVVSGRTPHTIYLVAPNQSGKRKT